MLLSETHILRFVPERTFLKPVRKESFGRIVSSSEQHLKVYSHATFEIKHFVEENTVVEIRETKTSILLPQPPVGFLKPKKFDYF